MLTRRHAQHQGPSSHTRALGPELGLLDEFSRTTDALGIVFIAMQTLPLAFRRRYPVTVLVVVLLGFLIRGLGQPRGRDHRRRPAG